MRSERILIVNVNWLGDTIFVTPLIRVLREEFPGSYIAILTHPRCREILNANPRINEIILYDEKGRDRHLLAKFSLVSRLRSKGFDTAFILRRSLTRNMIMLLSKIPDRIGYDSRKAGFLLTKRVPPLRKAVHKVEYFLNLARAAGIRPKSAGYEFFVSEKDEHNADKILEGIKKDEDFIVMNPGGNWGLKRWPPENFAELGDKIYERFGMKIVLTGAEKDTDLCRGISGLMDKKPVLLCGTTDLKTLGAVFKKARCVISNDSGPMHIAAALNTQVIALFGPTSPQITGPYGGGPCKVINKDVGCKIPCYKLSCENNKCMKAITVEDVIGAMS